MNKVQLEISFEAPTHFRPVVKNLNRRTRAKWWFEQMRRVVDSALDWKPVPRARPEQIYMGLVTSGSSR